MTMTGVARMRAMETILSKMCIFGLSEKLSTM